MAGPRASSRSAPRGKVQHWEILVCDDGLQGPGAAITDLLRAVNLLAALRGARQDPLAWQWTTPAGRAVSGSGGQGGPCGRRGERRQGSRVRLPDVIVVPGWQARNGPHLNRLVARDAAACARLRAVHAAGGRVLAVFTGVALVAEARLLERASAVVPWPFIAAVLRHEPTLELASTQPVATQDRVWTVDSPALATEAALALLKADAPQALADLAEAARAVLLPAPERQRLARAVAADARARVGPGSIERARLWLEEHLHEPYSLAATARAAATSERSLLRHFKASVGQTPLQWLHGMRVTRARMLLESSYLGTEAIAERCGWRDAAMLREVFRRATGLTPAAYRARFRLRSARREWGRDLR